MPHSNRPLGMQNDYRFENNYVTGDQARLGIVVYDEQCRACTAWMKFVSARDPERRLLFAPVHSWLGTNVMARAGMTPDDFDTMVFAEGDRQYIRSEAIIRILVHLGMPWSMSRVLLAVPASWRNHAYDVIAQNRYRWFGRQPTCDC